MTIQTGDKLPDATFVKVTENGPEQVNTADYFKGRKVALFSVPGAFTPTCSAKHLPGFVQHSEAIRGKGVDQIVCLSVNDAFVMDAWGKAQNVGDKVLMLADGNAEFSKAVGLTMDGTNYGMGTRACRYAMVIEDNTVKALNVEAPGAFEVSSAETMMKAL